MRCEGASVKGCPHRKRPASEDCIKPFAFPGALDSPPLHTGNLRLSKEKNINRDRHSAPFKGEGGLPTALSESDSQSRQKHPRLGDFLGLTRPTQLVSAHTCPFSG